MMKNSKLSKLLVAGVSVAMLASAVAPMAFAEETSTNQGLTGSGNYTVNIVGNTTIGEFSDGSALTDDPFKVVNTQNKYRALTFGEDPVTKKLTGTVDAAANYKTTNSFYHIDGWYVDGFVDGVKVDAKVNYRYDDGEDIVTDFSAEYLRSKYGKTQDFVTLVPKYTVDKFVTVQYKTGEDNIAAQDWQTSFAGLVSEDDLVTKDFASGSEITLPTVIANKDNALVGWVVYVNNYATTSFTGDGRKVQSEKVGSYWYSPTNKLSADSVKLSLDDDAVNNYAVVTIKPVVTPISNVDVTLKHVDTGENYLTIDVKDKDGTNIQLKDIGGKTVADQALLNQWGTYKTVQYGKTQELPALSTTTSGWTFSHWETDDKVKPAGYKTGDEKKTFKFTDEFDTTVLDATENSVTLKPIFVKGQSTDPVITYAPAAKTPNDKINKLADGKFVETKTWAEFNNFQGGLFYNEADGTASYYLNKNSDGKFAVDTTVNGLVDGIVFDKGVQDTEAYGLAKVSDADPFFYLVSDGVYKDDYQGLWCDEDGTWYYLIDGCCQTAANGVYEHTNGWYYNFKDGKMVETNGFQMHGTDFYWFVKGECKPEGGADCVEWDGDLYYIEGGKFVPTFNDTFKGSVFVNGVCDK